MLNRETLTTLGFGFAALLLAGCVSQAVQQAQSNQITSTLAQLGNSTVAQLTQVEAIADAATPPAPDLHACAAAGIVVQAAIQKENAAVTGQVVGALTVAAMASLYQPGSAQFNWATTTLETGCIAELHDVNQAVNSTTSIFSGISAVLKLAPVVAPAVGL